MLSIPFVSVQVSDAYVNVMSIIVFFSLHFILFDMFVAGKLPTVILSLVIRKIMFSVVPITVPCLLIKRYNIYKVLARSATFFQLSLFCATFFQLLKFMLFISSKTSSSQRVLGLPIGLLDMGFHLLIFRIVPCTAYKTNRPNYVKIILTVYCYIPDLQFTNTRGEGFKS